MLTKQDVIDAIAAAKKKVLLAMIAARQEVADLSSKIEHGAPSTPKEPGSAKPLHSGAEIHAACEHFDAAALILGEPVEAAKPKAAKAESTEVVA